MKGKEIETWSIEKSAELYGLTNWGGEYFGINEKGHVTVAPSGDSVKLDLHDLVEAVHQRGVELPVLFRFNGILRHRLKTIYQAFQSAIKEHNYTGQYFPAFPIKVNQQRHVVDVLNEAGTEFSMGLEVGSKPELIAVLGIPNGNESLLLCNGYKDREYIELALMSRKVGRRPIITIEKYSELDLILDVAERFGVEPEIGFRLRLAGKGAGRWERSGGDRAKFGLSMDEILRGFLELKRRGKLECLKLLHFHAGSQLTSIGSLKVALREAGQLYVQLRKECPSLEFVDVGGGLGVDYDGSKTTFESSMNYTIGEYARDIVWVLDEICTQGGVPHPHIVTESGRATVAHHSVLVFNVLGIANSFDSPVDAKEILERVKSRSVKTMAQLLIDLTAKNCQETLHDVMSLRSDMLEQFQLGLMSIEDRALGDRVYWALLAAMARVSKELNYIPEDLERLPAMLTGTYFCNLSIFQSMPDNWAIQQIFPITPIHRLHEEPKVPIVIADITCDSDGTIDRFPDLKDVKRNLNVHQIRVGEPYYFAAFLVGAYQEILGDLHNLFGDTNAVHVDTDDHGSPVFTQVIRGDTVREVLRYVQYEKDDLIENWRTALEAAVRRKAITPGESAEIFRKYANSFEGYTYLSDAPPESL